MHPIRLGDGTVVVPSGYEEVRKGDGTILFSQQEQSLYPLTIEDAEDGNMAEYLNVADTDYAAASSPVANGSFAVVNQSSAGQYTTSFAGLPFYPRRGDTLEYRAYLGSGSTRHQTDLLAWGDNLVSDGFVPANRYRIRLNLSAGKVLVDRTGQSDETIIDTTVTLPADEYLYVTVSLNVDYSWDITVENASGTELLNTSGTESASSAWPSGGLGYYSADATNAWDDIQLTNRAQPTTEFSEIGRSTATYINHPQGIYSSTDNTTYIAIQGPSLDPYAYAYEHTTSEWSGPVQIGENPMETDTHGPPAIVQDDNGTLHVFYGSHAGESPDQQYARSENPSDISAWTDQPALVADADGFTYPYPFWLDGRNELIVFLRESYGSNSSSGVTVARSTDRGNSWTYDRDVVEPGSDKTIYYRDAQLNPDGSIDLVMSHLDAPADTFNNVYHLVYDPSTQEFSSYDGVNFGTTATLSEMNADARVAQFSQPEPIYPNVTRDSNGDPAICYCLDDGTTRTLAYRAWTGSDYGAEETVFSGVGVKGLLSIDSGTPTIVAANDTASLGASSRTGSVSVEQWSRSGGSWGADETWWKQEDYVVPSPDSWRYPFLNRVRNADAELEYFWSEGYGGDFLQPIRSWAYGSDGYVDKY